MGVRIAEGALLRAWARAQHEELWLQVQGVDDLGVVEEAVQAANAAAEAAGGGDDAFGEAVSLAHRGPVVLLSRTGQRAAVLGWLAAMAAHLEGRGVEAGVVAAPQQHFPAWLSGEVQYPRQLTVLAASAVGRGAPDGTWRVDDSGTDRLARAAGGWGVTPGATAYLLSGLHQATVEDASPVLPNLLAAAATRHGQAGLYRVRRRPTRVTTSTLTSPGWRAHQVWDDAHTWGEVLDELLEVVVATAADTVMAFVERQPPLPLGWYNLGIAPLRLPHVEEYEVRAGAHLLASFVPDARGVLLLTDAHLARAADLSAWFLDALGGGRHLLRAKQLAPWLAGQQVDPDILARARADLGGMVMTHADLNG